MANFARFVLSAQQEKAPIRQEYDSYRPCCAATSKIYSSSGQSIVWLIPYILLIRVTLYVAM